MKPALQHEIMMMLWLIASFTGPRGVFALIASLVCVGHAALAVFYTWREIRENR